MDLKDLVNHIAEAVVSVDQSRVPHKGFQPGAGPYGEPQIVRLIAASLDQIPIFTGKVVTKRTPDLLIKGHWALEFKIARPYGDNGREAENWSVNLLHPYAGNVSSIADCWKLQSLQGNERRGVVVIGYEHVPPKIDLGALIKSFEAIAEHVAGLHLSTRVETRRVGLVHPVHQAARICAWEVLPSVTQT